MLNTALKYFLEVVNTGSLTEAAHKLHVAPSAISRMIRKLEDQHRTHLFERHARGMLLTEAGELLAEYARRTHLEAERMRTEISELTQLGQKLIKVSTNEAFGTELLPSVMSEFIKEEPMVRFQLNALQSAEINSRVRKGEDDLGLSYNLSPPQGVRVQYARRMPLFAIMRVDHPLAARKAMRLRDIGSLPVVMMGPGSTLRFIVDLCCMHEKVSLNVVLVCNHQAAIHNFCLGTGAIGFSGDRTLMGSVRRGELVAVPIVDELSPQRTLHIQTFEGRVLPSSVERFMQAVIRRIESYYGDEEGQAPLGA
ncbi:LysR family transcriptional regulator [Parapusillimonas granuli]|uniref:LysR family transcriptional regulator n=1 Tax=Parapusillimonas granuli TaxID=380911 RepID=A0A853G4K7_9BURK|nr:LysR family transcriptional regulator [Parapusillimonas granuli]MBB5214369.1 DNA-binding transcriptional LysR family regulator [Parapusillimonas granuli]MEB2399181.1 LysR family transcriptional regulator [Alcaligenaceae bacterium]NYT51097.1 LysR family transcriptional regulator [Parapusillimonas granuli]